MSFLSRQNIKKEIHNRNGITNLGNFVLTFQWECVCVFFFNHKMSQLTVKQNNITLEINSQKS